MNHHRTGKRFFMLWSFFRAAVFFVGVPLWAKTSFHLDFSDTVLINDTAFTLKDIAAIRGDDRATADVLGAFIAGVAAPPSYGRAVTTSELVVRLQHRFPDVAFTVSGSPRVFVATDFTKVTLARYQEFIEQYIDSMVDWKRGSWKVAISNGTESVKILSEVKNPTDAQNPTVPVQVMVSGLAGKPFPKGNTALKLHLMQGTKSYSLPVKCCITVIAPVFTALHDIGRGEILDAVDYKEETVDITRFAPVPLTKAEMVTGKRATRSIGKGSILHERLFETVPLVEKEDPVSIIHTIRGISISIAGIAREKGIAGDRIWVQNCTTNKLIRSIIISKGKVALLTGDREL